MKVQVILDDDFGKELQHEAKEMGFSLSSYLRFLIKSATNKTNAIDKALKETAEKISLEDFKKQLVNDA